MGNRVQPLLGEPSHYCLHAQGSFLAIRGIPTEQEYLSLDFVCPFNTIVSLELEQVVIS